MNQLIIVIGKVCSGKNTYAAQIKDAHIIDVGDVVRSIMKQQERVHDSKLDEKIFEVLVRDLLTNEYPKVAITGIRQESIVTALNSHLSNYDMWVVYLTGSLLTFKQRYEARNAQKDSKLTFEEVVKRDGELGLNQLEETLEEQKQYITTIYQPMKVTLYKKSRKDKLQQWTIETDENMFRTTEGYVDGALTPTAWTICEGKYIGAVNETTPQAQAIKEAEAKVQKQRDKGWADTADEIDGAKPAVSPKLAASYNKKNEPNLPVLKYIAETEVWGMMPKLDGIRALIAKMKMWSRTGKEMVCAPHVLPELIELLDGLPEGAIIDGELYNHELRDDFNEISSIVRQSKPTEEDLAKSEKLMEYHVFDIDMPGTFAARYAALKLLFEGKNFKYLKLVPVVFLNTASKAAFEVAVTELYEQWLELGYEGIMYVNAKAEYHNNRSKDLVKRKEMIDAEFKLTGIEEGRGNKAGMAARVYCVDERGEEFKAGIIGTEAFCKQLLAERDQHIGKMVTIQYQNLTPDRQVPRFCKMKAIRDYE